MKILVAGATGTLGGMVVQRLLADGHQVRALVRDAAKAGALEDAGVETVTGDLKEPASLDEACAGVDAVVTTANSAQRGGGDNIQTVEVEGNRNLVDAARRQGVDRFVFVSAFGAEPASPVPFLRGKGLAEEHLKESGLTWSIVKPTFFMEVWIGMIVVAPMAAGQPVTIVGEGRRKHSMVSMADVVAFTAAAVTNPAAANATVLVGGPEPLSWREIVAAAERVTGRPIELRTIAPGEPLPGLPQVVSELAAGLEFFDSALDMRETAATFGVQPTPLESYLRRTLQAPAGA